MSRHTNWTIYLLALLFLNACSGDKTFNDYARAGDTVAVAAGWKQNFNKENITVTITPSSGSAIIIPPGDPSIRASINLYPDPLSSAIISREIGKDLSTYATFYEGIITANYTKNDKDWYQKVVFVDLPSSLPTGPAQIQISNTEGASVTSQVEIIDGIGSPSTFTAQHSTNLTPNMLNALSRVQHYKISFTGATLPYAVEITLSHDPDEASGGIGRPYAVNPIGYKKDMAWTDDGTSLHAILTPTNSAKPMDDFNDYKFYVAGNIQNLTVSSVEAYDNDGNPITGTSATSTLER